MATTTATRQDGGAVAFVDQLADGEDFTITASDFGDRSSGWYDIEVYVVGAACDVKYLVSADGDFSAPDTNVTVDSFDSAGISEGNQTPVIVNRTAVRITNTSGGAADFSVAMRRR